MTRRLPRELPLAPLPPPLGAPPPVRRRRRGKATHYAHLPSGATLPLLVLNWLDDFAALNARFPKGLSVSFDGQTNIHVRFGDEQEEIEDVFLGAHHARYHGED